MTGYKVTYLFVNLILFLHLHCKKAVNTRRCLPTWRRSKLFSLCPDRGQLSLHITVWIFLPLTVTASLFARMKWIKNYHECSPFHLLMLISRSQCPSWVSRFSRGALSNSIMYWGCYLSVIGIFRSPNFSVQKFLNSVDKHLLGKEGILLHCILRSLALYRFLLYIVFF